MPHTSSDLEPCHVCDTPVAWWHGIGYRTPVEHAAPCGLPCIGGGVSIDVYRSRRVHAADSCPVCDGPPGHA